MKRSVICLAFVLLFVGVTNAQTKSMTGTVIDYTVGNRGTWAGITIKVGNKKYFVYTDSTTLPTAKIVGKVDEVGRRVRVFYTKIGNSPGYDGELSATRIVEIGESKSLSAQSSDWDAFWNSFRAAVRRRDKMALKRMMIVKFNSASGKSYSNPDARAAALQDLDWDHLDDVIRQGVGPLRKERGVTVRQAPASLNDVGMVAVFELGKDGRWRWADFFFYH